MTAPSSTASVLSRRQMLGAGVFVGATGILSACGGSSASSPPTTPTASAGAASSSSSSSSVVVAPRGLNAIAASKGLYYGAAVRSNQLSDAAFTAAFNAECGALVPEVSLKWGVNEQTRGRPDYSDADILLDHALRNGQKMRGHTAVWNLSTPRWLPTAVTTEPKGMQIVYDRVAQVVGRYKGRIFEWDVVNEAVEPKDNQPGGLKNSFLYQTGGEGFIGECYRVAHAADPDARLVYNEWGLDYKTDYEDARRLSTLKLLESLVAKGVPVHALGIQAHLKVGNRFDVKTYTTFLSDVAALGLKIIITELDIDDQRLVADFAERDRLVAEHATLYLEAALAQPAVIGVMTWGLSDKYTWLDTDRPRPDNLPHRALPLDDQMARKPMWQAMANAFASTSVRRA